MKYLFKVEQAASISGRPIVFALAPEQANFSISAGTRLHGCKVLTVDMPRSVDAEGKPRFLYAFVLADPNDLPKFNAGQQIALE